MNVPGPHKEFQDFSHEVHLAGSPATRVAFLGIGHFFVVLGVVGLFVPLLPTTDMLLIAAACYARGSARFYNWILNNRYLGPVILNWRRHGAISRRHKYVAIFLVIVVLGGSTWFFVDNSYAQGALFVLCAAIVGFLLRLPTMKSE